MSTIKNNLQPLSIHFPKLVFDNQEAEATVIHQNQAEEYHQSQKELHEEAREHRQSALKRKVGVHGIAVPSTPNIDSNQILYNRSYTKRRPNKKEKRVENTPSPCSLGISHLIYQTQSTPKVDEENSDNRSEFNEWMNAKEKYLIGGGDFTISNLVICLLDLKREF
jgi:hypothetical protein